MYSVILLTSGRHRKTKCNEGRPQCANCVKMNIECVWPASLLASLPHGSSFKIKKLPKKIGVDFIFYGDQKCGETNSRVSQVNAKHKGTKFKVHEMKFKVHEMKKEENNDLVEKISTFQEPLNLESLGLNDLIQNSPDQENSDLDPLDLEALDLEALDLEALDLDTLNLEVSDKPSLYEKLCYSQSEDNQDEEDHEFLESSPQDFANSLQVSFPRENDNDDLISSVFPLFFNSPQALDDEQNLVPYLGLTPLSGNKTWISGVEFSNNEPLFLHAFIHGFIPSISPQHCHPQLTPLAVFVPQGILEPIVRDVFYACGAAFIAHGNPQILPIARRRYANCLTSFANRLSATKGKIEEWMVAAALLFTLRDKFSGTTPELPTTHLSKAVELIRILRKTAGDKSVTLKFFVDSFLFNYSVVLITSGPLAKKLLPSPFKIFDEWRSVYEYQPFQCFAPWMNNPVFGAATKSFELAANASWLVHLFPLNDSDMVTACALLAESYQLELPKLSKPTKELSSRDFLHVQQSVAVNDICKLATQLLLIRLMHPTLELGHEIVSCRVRQILDIAKTICKDSTLWVICSWLLMITGLCVENDEDREFVLDNCRRAAELFRAALWAKICDFLEEAWGCADHPGPGWNHIFDVKALLTLCL